MTPKEKAQYLINKYLKLCVEKDYHQDFKLIQAKRGALIVVDEVVKQLEQYGYYKSLMTYWDAVKQEIENL